ncbi:phosphotransferase [Deinococcus sp. SDU3-2]|uniref:Phosphotransferase n=1 Tax=Deinococcus terrestris TaxID=2651870 RepID=A0A7X1NZD3_9DEIO|nr:phosphotransferase [Deinococcus terrestris]MPY68099.1 phosphotransferase [Deinococcus terrestris]
MTSAASDAVRVRFLISLADGTWVEFADQAVSATQLSVSGLQVYVRELSGLDAIVLHDAEALFRQPSPTVRMEALTSVQGLPTATCITDLPPHARPWQQPGWFTQAAAWLLGAVHASGDTATGPVRQISTYDLACVLYVETAAGGAYLKAGDGSREAAVTTRLAALQPELTVPVLRAALSRDWLATRAGGQRLSEVAELNPWQEAVTHLAAIHREVDPSVLRGLGCPEFPFRRLVEELEALVKSEALTRVWDQDEATRTRLREALPTIRQAHGRILALDLPERTVHGDAQPMNALVGADGVRWFDWSEAGVAHPFLDIGWLLAWVSLRPSLPVRTTHPQLVETLWEDYLRALGTAKTGAAWQDARLLALAHRVLAYEQRFRSWEGTVSGARPYVPYYLKLLIKLAEEA